MDCIGLSQACRTGATDGGRVVGARHGDGDGLRRSIRSGHRHAICIRRAGDKGVLRRVHGVGPHTARGHAEGAVSVSACRVGLRHKRGGAVDIGHRQCACGGLYRIGLC